MATSSGVIKALNAFQVLKEVGCKESHLGGQLLEKLEVEGFLRFKSASMEELNVSAFEMAMVR